MIVKRTIKIFLIALGIAAVLFIGFNLLLLYTPFWVLMPSEIQEAVIQFKIAKNLAKSSEIKSAEEYLLVQGGNFDSEKAINLMFDKNRLPSERCLAIRMLGVWVRDYNPDEKEEVGEFFKEIVADSDNPEVVRLEAINGMNLLGSKGELEVLEEVIDNKNISPELRWSSIIALENKENAPWQLFLEELKNDPDDTVRFKAAQAIWETAPPEVIPELLDIALDEHNRPSTRDYAIVAIRNIASQRGIKDLSSIKYLKTLLKDKEFRVRISVSEALLALTGKHWEVEEGTEEELFRE